MGQALPKPADQTPPNLLLASPLLHCSTLPRTAPPQKSPILTPAEAEQRRLEAEAALEEELAASRARRALMAQMEEESKKALPRSEMDRIRERERREVISKAQLALLVGNSDVLL